MLLSRTDSIINFSNKLRNTLGVSHTDDICSTLSTLNGTIVHKHFDEFEIAKITKVDNDGFVIDTPLYPSNHTNLSNQFIKYNTAHMLGHLFLHMGYLIDESKWEKLSIYQDSAYYRMGHNIEEYEADLFAMSFLMPKPVFFEVSKKHKVNHVYDTKAISEVFNIPDEKVKLWGRYLGLYSWI